VKGEVQGQKKEFLEKQKRKTKEDERETIRQDRGKKSPRQKSNIRKVDDSSWGHLKNRGNRRRKRGKGNKWGKARGLGESQGGGK